MKRLYGARKMVIRGCMGASERHSWSCMGANESLVWLCGANKSSGVVWELVKR